ncbi:MAG: 8-amino-7-oxononanoate synthase [Pseudomarimonas sp.]
MGRPSLSERLARQQVEREAASARRKLFAVDARDGVRVHREGRWLLDFASNDYLGLAQHPAVIAAMCEAANAHGAGSTAAHLVTGHHQLHQQLEDAVADWLGQPRALLFGSGYLANLGVMQALLSAHDLCVQDKLNHACLLDGARLSGAQLRRYPHADINAATRQLQSAPERAALLATDGVFSMDGDIAPLRELASLARAESAVLYIDDAHGVGVHGPQGRGSAALLALHADDTPLQLVTLSKALGGYGALVVGSDPLIEAVLQGARSYLFTTALPPALAAASLAAMRIARNDEQRRQRLHHNIARFRDGASQLGLPLLPSSTPIQPILVGDNASVLAIAARLATGGLLVPAIRPPTVPAGQARLRITLSAAHADEHIDRLLDGLHAALCAHPGPLA